MASTLKRQWRLLRRRLRHAVRDIGTFTHPWVKIAIVGVLMVGTAALVVYTLSAT